MPTGPVSFCFCLLILSVKPGQVTKVKPDNIKWGKGFTQVSCPLRLSIHAAEEGTLSVNTGNTRAVRDLIRNERVSRGPDLNLPLKKGETRVLFMEP
ncbi:MAG: hypothetical protein EBS01_08870 [Verrucomicrobia bacterium]|nr:hypothetical protein [Verrucomicrobiota bacterium]